MSRSTRRDFLKGALAAGALAGVAPQIFAAKTEKRLATDWVTLGNSGVKVTRLAFGTGTHGGRIQREARHRGYVEVMAAATLVPAALGALRPPRQVAGTAGRPGRPGRRG